MRARLWTWIVAGVLGCLGAPAHADPRADIARKAKAAMIRYDSMDYEQARKLLYQALAIAKKARLEKDPIVARVYLDLGITQFAGSDHEAAKLAFLSAAQIDPKIAIGAAYKSPELVQLLDDAKAAAAADGAEPDDPSCKAIRGLQHTLPDGARRGGPQTIEASIGGDVLPTRVVVMYRAEAALDFLEARLTRQGGCRYAGTIPASATRGNFVHYYLAAYDANNKVLAANGSSSTPNVLDFRAPGRVATEPGAAAAAPAGGPDDPAHRKPLEVRAADPRTGIATGSITARGHAPTILLAVSGGTGVGYVTGRTEGDNQVETCCIGASLIVVSPELGYYVTPRLTVGLAARLGVPLGANVAGHATLAPAGFVRARYALSRSGDGLHAMAELGAGVLRNTVKLGADVTGSGPGMDTDIVAQGPLLVGAGIGYRRQLTDTIALQVELDAMAGIAVTKKLGSAVHLNTGISADLSLGLAVGF